MVGFDGRGLRPQPEVSEKALPLPPSRQTLTDSVYEAVMELVMDQHIEAGARGNNHPVRRPLDVSPPTGREGLAPPGTGGPVGPAPRRGCSPAPLLDND